MGGSRWQQRAVYFGYKFSLVAGDALILFYTYRRMRSAIPVSVSVISYQVRVFKDAAKAN